ncbi:MAG: hypothetical protein R3C68_16355 [Myxococcota bacterium]
MGRFFRHLHDDFSARRIPAGRAVLLVCAIIFLLAPSQIVYFIAEPVLLLSASVVTLYAANLCARTAKWKTSPHYRPSSHCVSWRSCSYTMDSRLPAKPGYLFSPVSAPSLSWLLSPWQATGDAFASTIVCCARLGHRRGIRDLSSRIGVIQGAAMSILDTDAFLQTAIMEIGRQLGVRRASLVLVHTDGKLRVRASIGLPQHLVAGVLPSDSGIASWVFRNNQLLTGTYAERLHNESRQGAASIHAFISHPVLSHRQGRRCTQCFRPQ